ncbi:unnamed protein product, partial [Prorocentrum cordatum]
MAWPRGSGRLPAHTLRQAAAGATPARRAPGGTRWRSSPPAALQVQLEEEQPQQAALLLGAFARLRHSRDPALFGRFF